MSAAISGSGVRAVPDVATLFRAMNLDGRHGDANARPGHDELTGSEVDQVTQRPGCSSFATSVKTLTGGSQATVGFLVSGFFVSGFAGSGRFRA